MTKIRHCHTRLDRIRRGYRRAHRDARYDPLRAPRGHRRLVALVPLVVAFPLTGLHWDEGRSSGAVVLASVLLELALYMALRRVTRSLADSPSDVLDERELAQRDGVFRPAYTSLTVSALALFGGAYAASTFSFEIRPGRLFALWLSFQALSLLSPATLIAVRLPAEDRDLTFG